tara:strand:+ start:259 stop:948 length:690 start_codon:yes stop_codon:yes gene_type:complete
VSIKENIESIEKKIQAAKRRSGCKQNVEIIAVTKTRPFSIIEEVYREGLLSVGENRVQEAETKFKSFNKMPGFTRRFIGHLQSNKVKKCLRLFDTVDSVHKYKLLKKISVVAEQREKTIPVLLQINTSEEPQKNGFSPNQTEDLLRCFELKNVTIKGLMTVGPNTKDTKKIKDSFVLLRELKSLINNHLNSNKISELSMGMSGDYEIAVEEGSTMVRLGTALFGRRKYK